MTMKYTAFHESRFRESVENALRQIKTILDVTRNPRLAEFEDHTFDDKFALAEFLTNTSVATQMNALERLGLDSETLQKVTDWVHKDKESVTLRFQADDGCSFLKEQDVEMQSTQPEREYETTANATTSSGFFGTGTTKTETVKTKVINKVKEYHWKIEFSYKLLVFKGTEVADALELQSRSASTVLVTSGGMARAGGGSGPSGKLNFPISEHTVHPPIDCNLTWFFTMITPKELVCQFGIDRTSEESKQTCKTPRRNKQVDDAVEFNSSLRDWADRTSSFLLNRLDHDIFGKHNPVNINPMMPDMSEIAPGTRAKIIGLRKEPAFNGKTVVVIEHQKDQQRYRVEPVDPKDGLPHSLVIRRSNLDVESNAPGSNASSLASISTGQLLCPIVPLMEKECVLSMNDVGELLAEHGRSLDEALEQLFKTYPPKQLQKLVSVAEAQLVLICKHLVDLTNEYEDGVDYIEDMLKQQLIQAIGKEVSSKDFDQFMRFHNQRLFGPTFAPKPFSYSIRRPNHFPDGVLSIEATRDKNEPIETWVRHVQGQSNPPISIPIGAATSVEITGDRYLHGWMQHRFKTKPKAEYQAILRARQFSSFLVVIGTMAGPDVFEPKDAVILQNKDEVLLPLLANPLPSAKEFKDAIASLSPEQKAFATAFRSMQLESSVFGICVIQIKPQLEKLLGLPDGALTKEIQLTQDLLSLFVEYQIPSDLLSFDGTTATDTNEKVATVKQYVDNVLKVIEGEKQKQLKEEEMKADMRAELNFTGAPAAAPHSEQQAIHDESESTTASTPSRSRMRRKLAYAEPQMAIMTMPMMAMSAPRGSGPPPASSNHYSSSQPTYSEKPLRRSQTPPINFKMEPVQPFIQKSSKQITSDQRVLGDDFTLIPKILDEKLERLDTDGALRSTIIKTGPTWVRMRQPNLLSPVKSTTMYSGDIEKEKKKAFDLLDAISRSGTLSIDCAELHVVIAVSHCFENDMMGTVIQDNINPIEKVERSSLMIASVVHSHPIPSMIAGEQNVQRLTTAFPLLFTNE